ncbi:hypothetical protein A3K86_13990 [Photobacterium jeanii]|uniref:DUF945 domain-containing protein n=1 Tax=Photobacterium jeanii TaxID=858640 RepID=A0A178KAH5_9GAMM|nr:DUF945 family protein [Photobacterium jeanii]OAN13682.1 hypothetical protein A3K86_13990 [Photobacterium jeanii]PST88803.1 DUF945 domain-containing protein [Photobacterium jeanii]
MSLKKIGAIGGAISVALCWPIAVGQIGERIYLDTVGKYENPYLKITSESYDRGYLTSQAVSRIEIKDEFKPVFEEEGLPTVYHVDHQLEHGFFGVKSFSQLELDDNVKELAAELWGSDIPPVTFTTDTALTRTTKFKVVVNPIAYKDDFGGSVASQPMIFKGVVDAKGAGEFHYHLPQLNVTSSANETMALHNFAGGGKGRMDGQFWLGTQQATLDSVTFTDSQNDKSMSLKNLSVDMSNVLKEPDAKSEGAEENTRLTNINGVKVAEIVSVDGKKYENFNFSLSFADLDYPAIQRLGAMSDDINEQMTLEQQKEALLALDLLVAKGLSLAVDDLSVTTPEGDVRSYVRFTVSPGLARASQSVEKIAEKLTGAIMLEVPKALVEKNPVAAERVKMMEQAQIVEVKDDKFVLNMQVEGDKVILANGDQLPLGMLFMLFM